MTHWKKLREPPPHLGAWSFEVPNKVGEYRRVVFEIERITSDKVVSAEKKNGEKCLLLWFKGVTKPMIANATNCRTLSSLYGVDVECWPGKFCEVYVVDVQVGREKVKGLRISSKKPAPKAGDFVEAPVNEETRAAQDEAFGRGQEEPGANG